MSNLSPITVWHDETSDVHGWIVDLAEGDTSDTLAVCETEAEAQTLASHLRQYAASLPNPAALCAALKARVRVWQGATRARAKAARLLGRIRSPKKAASSARNALLGGALGGRPRQVYKAEHEWSTITIYASKRGWIVETDSRISGTWTGERYALDYSPEIPAGQDLNAPWNEGVTYADILVERRRWPGSRCVRRGIIVR
jgi:hypothetical protein